MIDLNIPKISSTVLRLLDYHQVFSLPDPDLCDAIPLETIQALISNSWRYSHNGYIRSIYSDLNRNRQIQVSVKGIVDSRNIKYIHKKIIQGLAEVLLKQRAIKFTDNSSFKSKLIMPKMYEQAPTNVISKMGIELEGGWNYAPTNHQVFHDGSVKIKIKPKNQILSKDDYPFDTSYDVTPNYTGEIRTIPASPEEFPWEAELISEYPPYVNATCGMHVHYSFRSIGVYASYVHPAFTPWLIHSLKAWLVKKSDLAIDSNWMAYRLEGKNHFCEPNYNPSEQLTSRRGNPTRYAVVNYCYAKHKTMEIRVLPMFLNPYKAKEAIVELTRLVNLWGNKMGPKPRQGVLLYETKTYYIN